MKRAVLLGVMCLASACSHGTRPFGRAPDAGLDSLYWRAVTQLDAANKQGSLDTALVQLDAYLASGTSQPHRREALVLRQLARDARQLARVEVILAQVRNDTTAYSRPHTEAEARRREEEAVKEVQRLKDELAKANEELERIRKRLATPKPPTIH